MIFIEELESRLAELWNAFNNDTLQNKNEIIYSTFSRPFLLGIAKFLDYKNKSSENIREKYQDTFPVSSKISGMKVLNLLQFRNGIQPSIKNISQEFNCSYSTLIKYIKAELGFKFQFYNAKNFRIDNGIKYYEVLIYSIEFFQRIIDGKIPIYLDETSHSRNKNKRKIWGKPGVQIFGISQTNTPYLNQILATNYDGVIHNKFLTTTNNRFTFCLYLKELIRIAKFRYNDNFFLIFDNSPIHTAKLCKSFLFNEDIDCIFLASYMPETNMVELCFNTLKQALRQTNIYNVKEKVAQNIVINESNNILLNLNSEHYYSMYLKSIDNLINYLKNNGTS